MLLNAGLKVGTESHEWWDIFRFLKSMMMLDSMHDILAIFANFCN